MSTKESLDQIFPASVKLLDSDLQTKAKGLFNTYGAESFPEGMRRLVQRHNAPAFLPELAGLELAVFRARECSLRKDRHEEISVNPCLEMLELEWKNLCAFIPGSGHRKAIKPVREKEKVIVWPGKNREVIFRSATLNDLLALKLIVEHIPVDLAARENKTTAAHVWPVVNQAVKNNILVRNDSLIRRDKSMINARFPQSSRYHEADVFTLQWHITQACDLKCKHCYGRESREFLNLEKSLKVLDDFDCFCRKKNVHGQVSLTGGNPMLHPDLEKIHEAAVNYGFTVGILGNPAPEEQLKKLLKAGPVSFYQVSLEGLEEHNDYIRGKGHYKKIFDFLDILKKQGIYSMVMLTLTRANTREVVPLARKLQDRADLYTFNRLSMVGEGSYLTPADKDEFRDLLQDYHEKARQLPVMQFKDNLLNLFRHQADLPFFGGCTGYGCGAAFNFVSVLCDGEVHACRKFPSRLGNIFNNTLEEIYDSEIAGKYREGPEQCRGCVIRPVCRGCLAVAHSKRLDVFKERDPYCFYEG